MQFGILGPLVVRPSGGDPVAVGGPRPRAVLAMLLLDAGRLVSLERLIDGQYGDRPPAGAANAVQAQISRLRRALPDGLIEFHGAGYRLAADRDDVDAHRFERLTREGRGLLAAGRAAEAAAVLREGLELWRGPAFADVADAPFAGPQALRLEELRLAAAEDLSEAELSLPDARPVAGLRELVAAHPLRERPRGLLMRALDAAGRQAEALAVYEEGRRLLAHELGADPSPELAALHLEILRGERPAQPRGWSAPPAQLTTFVGREAELARLTALHDARLITVVGPGGTGKTRLALEWIAHAPDAQGKSAALRPSTGRDPHVTPHHRGAGRRDGQVCFVDLGVVEGGVAAAVLAAAGLREPALRPLAADGPDPVERLVAAFGGRPLLLVLDNCEHVVTEAATLARRLLAGCPGLTILATSREPLGITGEHLVPLAPLPVPSPEEAPADPLACAAVRLFADRAAAVRPGFEVGPHNLGAVLRICAALDGLPLAIELAAARVRTFGVAEIADRLAEHGRFRLLSRGDRTAAARHRTLHAVVEWSWDLLDAEEQALARRFAVFAGGASLEAVEGVCGTAESLVGLVDKSLVETDGERYQMLDTIRLFCLERLAEAGEEARFRQAHAAWFLEFARRAGDRLYRDEQLTWLARLSADNANLQAALRWSVEHDRPTAWRLVAALAMYWWLSGRRGQATRHAVRLLDATGPEPPAGLAEEYVMAVLHAVPEAGSPHWERARQIMGSSDRPMRYRFGVALWGMLAGPPEPWSQDGPQSGQDAPVLGSEPWSRALGRLSVALMLLLGGSPADGERELERVLADFGAVGERWGTAQALDWLALAASWRGDWARAFPLWERALGLLEELGALDELADVMGRRAEARLRAGDVRAARADHERVGELERRLGRPELMAWVHLQLGELARYEGDLPEAARRLETALAGSRTGAFTAEGTRARVYTALGRLATAKGAAEEAERLHALAVTTALHSPMSSDLADAAEGLASVREPAEQAALLLGIGVALRGVAVVGDRDVAAAAAEATRSLGPDGFATAYAQGAAMTRAAARATLRRAAAALTEPATQRDGEPPH
ncbi:BTAD domain-containing putative transcriptional regulator [Nonomuraea aridisoli]|uniref:AfsR family transcriptional regulator n=1 Tax=Nonomuraea aridisoli TaxID=2070368 RepID=A0A2W2FW11_9ACTN|nr:BTAD domain-containing putative transcriptional regulator [Nonomuraea aridisoli]PZG19034.1 AfsR family transcriptional regulator [Nonomuraea aridisoli]